MNLLIKLEFKDLFVISEPLDQWSITFHFVALLAQNSNFEIDAIWLVKNFLVKNALCDLKNLKQRILISIIYFYKIKFEKSTYLSFKIFKIHFWGWNGKSSKFGVKFRLNRQEPLRLRYITATGSHFLHFFLIRLKFLKICFSSGKLTFILLLIK